MKLIKISAIALIIAFSVSFAKAQSVFIGARVGYAHPYHPYHRVIVQRPYPVYGYNNYPVYYHRPLYIRRGYYERPVGYRYYSDRPYYRRHW